MLESGGVPDRNYVIDMLGKFSFFLFFEFLSPNELLDGRLFDTRMFARRGRRRKKH